MQKPCEKDDSSDIQDPFLPKEEIYDALSPRNIWAYGTGHFMNDLCSACWFNYLLVYLKTINPIDPVNPGFYASYEIVSFF